MTVDESFQHFMDHEYTQGMTTQEALRSAFETGAKAQKERDLAAVEDVKVKGNAFVIATCDVIERRIKGE